MTKKLSIVEELKYIRLISDIKKIYEENGEEKAYSYLKTLSEDNLNIILERKGSEAAGSIGDWLAGGIRNLFGIKPEAPKGDAPKAVEGEILPKGTREGDNAIDITPPVGGGRGTSRGPTADEIRTQQTIDSRGASQGGPRADQIRDQQIIDTRGASQGGPTAADRLKAAAGVAAGTAAVVGANKLMGPDGNQTASADPGVPPQDPMGNPSPGTATDVSGAPFTPPAKPEPPKAEPPKPEKPNYDSMSFGDAFKAAREAAKGKGAESTGQFTWRGKEYQTNVKGEKYVAPSKQTKVNESLLAAFNQVVSSKHPNLFAEAAKKNLDEAGGIYPQGGYDTGRSRTWGPVNPTLGIGAGDNRFDSTKPVATTEKPLTGEDAIAADKAAQQAQDLANSKRIESEREAAKTYAAPFETPAVDAMGNVTGMSNPTGADAIAVDKKAISIAQDGQKAQVQGAQQAAQITATGDKNLGLDKAAATPTADYSTTVKKGDNLWNLVKARGKAGMSNQEIANEVNRVAKLNKMADPNKLSIGQSIKFNEGTEPKTEKEKKLAALAEPKDKITHKDVLVGRGVVKEASLFSEAELAHMEAVAPTPKKYASSGTDKSRADGSKSGTLSDETNAEYAFNLLRKAKPVPMPNYQTLPDKFDSEQGEVQNLPYFPGKTPTGTLKKLPYMFDQPKSQIQKLSTVSEAKVGRKSEEESLGDNMLHMNAKRAADNMNNIKHKFANGETVNMTKGMAVAFMNRHAAAKTADQKDAVLKHANKSFDSFKSVVAGDKIPEPEKNTIKLGTMKGK